ncbi:N-6 DNA methylase [Thermopolyspora sp. NPDC052614]|uniref:N-6 DNA methylase n=1 Tax=Thermopolyspora sp. NPDC052614 TaxID=3155682 RepID=UPI003435AE06
MSEEPIAVTLAEIARLAGVGRAAVSNWRRRHADFPSPVGGTDASPQFSLREVEAWLRENRKAQSPVGTRHRLWLRYEALGDRDRMGRLIAELGARVRDASSGPRTVHRPVEPPVLEAEERALLDETVELARGEGGEQIFQFLLSRWLGTHIRQITTTPGPLAALMAEIARQVRPGRVTTVLDPACGTGTLLLAAAERWSRGGLLRLLGQDHDSVLADIACSRLALRADVAEIDVRASDTLRADLHSGGTADVILCNPPTNERDWGHAELATDARWLFGLPPRTESELAWVQHVIAALAEDGVAVVLLPPAVAARRAGRRIRAALLRAGAVRMVVALPPGAAPPYGIGLHLWVLRRSSQPGAEASVLLVDAGDCRATAPSSGPGQGVDWEAVRGRVLDAIRGEAPTGSVEVPLMDLLGEDTDLTPARHVPSGAAASAINLRQAWTRFDRGLRSAQDLGADLRRLTVVPGTAASFVSVAELEGAEALTIATGQSPPEAFLRRGDRPGDGVPVLTVADLRSPRQPRFWLTPEDVEKLEADRSVTVTSSNDVIVVGLSAEFDAWVDVAGPVVLGPQIHRVRPDLERLDPWFLAACLRAPSNARQAGTHATSASRVDVRRLQVLRLPLEEQRRYGEAHRRLVEFERAIADVREEGTALRRTLVELLATGRLA